MTDNSCKKTPALCAALIAVIALCAVSVSVIADNHNASDDDVEIPGWLADGADYAEKVYKSDDHSQGYDFIVHYANGKITTIPCTQEGQEFTPVKLPENSIVVTCGSS